MPDGGSAIVAFPTNPTPGEGNYLPLTSAVINEVLSHTDPPLEDAIELANPTAAPLNIGGWYLSDSQGELKKFRIPDNTVIPAGGFTVFYQYQFDPNPGHSPALPWIRLMATRCIYRRRTQAAILLAIVPGCNLARRKTGFLWAVILTAPAWSS